MSETLVEKLTGTADGMRLYQQERAILEVTELICELMAEQNVTRSELANQLGRTKGYVTQLLDGRANMTVRTISDVLTALDRALHFQEGPLSATVRGGITLTITSSTSSGLGWEQPDEAWSSEMEIPVGAIERPGRLAG